MNEKPASLSPDPFLDEIRAIKQRISERFGHDVRKLCDHLRQKQAT